ncbi:MAG TPA: hypothetical protein VMO20_08065 [Candidatus Acidoferrum sp.]|nr:hypothetical protein [Candidatus Acidoferrum sp.]
MTADQPQRVDIIAVNSAVHSFVMVVLFVIGLIIFKVSFPGGLALTGAAAVALHLLTILSFSRSVKPGHFLADAGGVKLLEYTISFVCWTLYAVMWWYRALDVTFIFLFIPTYFATSLATYHVCFNYFARLEINKKTLALLVINLWTLSRYLLIWNSDHFHSLRRAFE